MKSISNLRYYTVEEIELNKFYYRGDGLYKLTERTGKVVESYPGVFNKTYKFVVFDTETCNYRQYEMVLNPNYECFRNVEKSELEYLIKKQKQRLDNLDSVFKECVF